MAKADQTALIRTAVIGFVLLIAILLAYRSTRRARREVMTPIDIGAIRAAPMPAVPEPTEIVALETPAPAQDPMIAASREALDELSALADRRPEEVAQILQSWLSDEVTPR